MLAYSEWSTDTAAGHPGNDLHHKFMLGEFSAQFLAPPSLAGRTGRGPEGGAGRPRPLPRRTRDHRPWRKSIWGLPAIAGAVIVLTGHWAATDEMIADLIAGGLVHAVGIGVLLRWSFQR